MCKVILLYTYFFMVIYMEEDIKYNMLYDIYGKLLTDKQQAIFEEYYLYNLSLREIAQNKKISYQAVRDSIKNRKEMLDKYESIIGMNEHLENVEKIKDMCNKGVIDKEKILKLLEVKK